MLNSLLLPSPRVRLARRLEVVGWVVNQQDAHAGPKDVAALRWSRLASATESQSHSFVIRPIRYN